MSFNPNDYVSPYITLEEVLEIKKAFDLFDRDLGGAIDPRGKPTHIQNLKLPSTHWESKPKLKPSIRWSLNSTQMAVAKSNSLSFSTWWPLVLPITNPETKFTRSLWLSTVRRLDSSLWKIWEKLQKIWENWLMTKLCKIWSKELTLMETVWWAKNNSTTSSPKRHTDRYIHHLKQSITDSLIVDISTKRINLEGDVINLQ